MIARSLFVCGALLLFANVAFGDGTYQPTKNGRTLVWNNHPKPGDEATWWGGRDHEGYAHGFGTVTWYSVRHERETSSAKPALYASYWGNMVRGKLEGQVNIHSNGKTHYAIFTDGVRRTRWASGPAPSGAMAEWRAAVAAVKPSKAPEPEPPAAGPRAGGAAKTQTPRSKSAIAESSQPSTNASAARTNSQPSKDQPKTNASNSTPPWVGPPRALRTESVGSPAGANPAPPANARLTKEEVVDLAEAIARSHGYDLGEYQSPEPQFDPADKTWSLLYDQKPVAGTTEMGKHFSVAVDDKTKRAALVGK